MRLIKPEIDKKIRQECSPPLKRVIERDNCSGEILSDEMFLVGPDEIDEYRRIENEVPF